MYGPYNIQESINWLRKFFIAPVKNQAFYPAFPPNITTVNNFNPVFDITFVGDLMSLHGCTLELGPKLLQIISQNKYLVANLEAPLTTKKGIASLKQFNHPSILELFKRLKSPSDIYFSVANNHSNDFGHTEFSKNLEILRQNGFNYFGTQSMPYTIVDKSVILYGATEWSNTSKEGLSLYSNRLNPPKINHLKKPISILYPHWGFEFEIYPRAQLLQRAHLHMQNWDAIIGHHSHCPQPISLLENSSGGLRPIVHSLGNFAIAYQKDVLNYGLVVTLSIGNINDFAKNNHEFVIGQLSWNFISIKLINKQTVFVEICDTCPYFIETPSSMSN